MQKSDLDVVQHSGCELGDVSLELRLFIETIACSSCPMSARSSQMLRADSERQTQKYQVAGDAPALPYAAGILPDHGRVGFTVKCLAELGHI